MVQTQQRKKNSINFSCSVESGKTVAKSDILLKISLLALHVEVFWILIDSTSSE